jgi:hypothetical protein
VAHVTFESHVSLLTTYRTPERVVQGVCPMCLRDRQIVFDITFAIARGEFETWSICDECAPRAARLLAWLGGSQAS